MSLMERKNNTSGNDQVRADDWSFPIILEGLTFVLVIAIFYGILAIQPLSFDDWSVSIPSLLHPWPETGQQIRWYFSGYYYLVTSPFSFFKPYSLLTAIVATSLLWGALINETLLIRVILVLLGVFGFPYLGHIGPWNIAASHYTVSVVWMILWYFLYRRSCQTNTHFFGKGITLFCITFIAASWHEVWTVAFGGIVVYLLWDAGMLARQRHKSLVEKLLSIHLSVILGAVLAVAFYTKGGSSKFLDERAHTPGFFVSLLNWHHFVNALLTGTRTTLLMFKDALPVFLMVLFIKLDKRFRNVLSRDFRLFAAIALGSILFLYINAFLQGPAHWRVRCLCVVAVSVAFYAFEPSGGWAALLRLGERGRSLKLVRGCLLAVVSVWFAYNTYFTYVYTNIDVAGWLQYRRAVVAHDPRTLSSPFGHTLPAGRPRGAAHWDHIWGAQDDKYRFFSAPSIPQVITQIRYLWALKK